MPPLIGWAAVRGRLDPEAWVLFAIVFLWQFPHFMAIAWMYREDYARAGYLVLPLDETRNRFVTWHTLLPSLALLPVGLITAIPDKPGLGGLRAWCDLSLLCRTFCFSQVEYRRTTSTDRFDHLSPFGLRPNCRA
jgi:heme O synthase-like polyprenyltransferase